MKKIILSVILTICLFITYLVADRVRLDNILNDKIKNYGEVIKIVNDTNLYRKEKNKFINIGDINKDLILYLDKPNYKLDYFKIKNTDYYISYLDITKSKKEKKKINYIYFNEDVITKKKFKLSDSITINESMKLPILTKNNGYDVLFNNDIYHIEEDSVEKIVESNNSDIAVANKISVLNIKNMSEELLKYIKENNYLTISIDDYKLWLNKKINLPINTILLIGKSLDESLIFNEPTDLKLNDNNSVSEQELSTTINSYLVDNTNLEDLKKMLKGEKIVYVKEIYTNPSSSSEISVPVLNYHFFYDSSIGENNCNESICLDTSKFEEHLKYLKDNNFKTLTIEEFRAWLYGEIEIPNKSVLLTVDDGAMGTSTINGNKLIPLLEKYDLHATLFLVTAWWDVNNYRSNNLDIQSHGNDIHKIGSCGSQNINCLSYDELYNDFKASMDAIGSNTSFCFPFYVKNSRSIDVLKALGVKMAFGGGNFNATRSSNKYYIPRYPIYSSITMDQFINMVN